MADNTVKGVKCKVMVKDSVKHSDAVNVVVKISSPLRLKHLTDISLTRVSERSVSYIVSESYRLNKVKVKVKGSTDSSCNTRNYLHVQSASRYIVILIKGEYLRFIGIAVIIRAVHNLVRITHIRRTPNRLLVRIGITSYGISTFCTEIRTCSARNILFNPLTYLRRELFIKSLSHRSYLLSFTYYMLSYKIR